MKCIYALKLIKGEAKMTKEYNWKQLPGTFPWMAQQKKAPLEKREIPYYENYERAIKGNNPVWLPVAGAEKNICWPDEMVEHPVPEVDGFDWWGVEWVMVETAGGMMVKPGTRVIEDFTTWKETFKWPDYSDVDWAADGEKISSNYDPDRAHVYQCVEGLFERLHELMPFDETLMLFYEEPELLSDWFEKCTDYKIDTTAKVFEHYGRIDGVLYHDDWGTQRAGFFSNEMFREQIFPHTKRFFDFIKEQGRFVELHSCGRNMQYVPMMIEMGVDMWGPQENCNDMDHLIDAFGEQMTFTKSIEGLNDKEVMDEAEVRAIVREYVDKYKDRRVMASFRTNPERSKIVNDELYKYSKEVYAKKQK